jgi:hypothetical protein
MMIWAGSRACAICRSNSPVPFIKIDDVTTGVNGVQGGRLSGPVVQAIGQYRNHGVRWDLLPLSWYWTYQNQGIGHRTLLVVDTVHRTYRLYDPNGVNYQIDARRIYSRHQLLLDLAAARGALYPGYRALGDHYPACHRSLQSTVKRGEVGAVERQALSGLCAILVFWVTLTCVRLQYFDVFDVAESI